MSLSLEADHTYYFGIIADAAMTLDFNPEGKKKIVTPTDGLSLGGQAIYTDYDNPEGFMRTKSHKKGHWLYYSA